MCCSFDDGSIVPGSPTAEERCRPQGTAPEAGGSGGDPSNTPPSITKCDGGEDWLELALYLHHQQFSQLEKRLDAAKEQAESPDSGPVEVEIGGRPFMALPGSATVGSDEKQLRYRWRLQAPDGWVLLLMRRATPHTTMPNGIARASSIPLLRLGTKAYVRQVHETLHDLDIQLLEDKVSRVDACADLVGMTVDSLYEAFSKGNYVSRARTSTDHLVEEYFEGYRVGRRPSGFRIGKGSIGLRVYDKWRECKDDSEKLLLMQTRRWGGIGGDATRAEFQVRRARLKELGVNSLSDWYKKRGSVVSYLSTEWCRVTASAVDSRHADRSPIHPDWIKIQQAFTNWAGSAIEELAPLPRLEVPAEDLLNQVIGVLCSYHARRRRPITSNQEFLDRTLQEIARGIQNRNMTEEARLRALKLGVPWT